MKRARRARTDDGRPTTDMKRNLTARDFFKLFTCEALLQCKQLSAQERYEQAAFARTVRNFFFTATLQPQFIFLGTAALDLKSATPGFSEPMIVTDLISTFELGQGSATEPGEVAAIKLEVLEYGAREHSNGLDFFGLSGMSFQDYILKHEENRPVVVVLLGNLIEHEPTWIAFVPRLLAPYQTLRFNYELDSFTTKVTQQAGVRAVRVIPADNPYGYFSALNAEAIRQHINAVEPEMFLLEAKLPIAQFPALGVTANPIKTPQMERPLLVLGATCNIQGCQARLEDESSYYEFTAIDFPLTRVPGIPLYKAPPLNLWATNSDFRNPNTYNMFPVPHLLMPGSQLRITLTNGLTPDNAGVFTQAMSTRTEQDARITFLCRTV